MKTFNLKLATARALLKMAHETTVTSDARHFVLSGLVHASEAVGCASGVDETATALELRDELMDAVHSIQDVAVSQARDMGRAQALAEAKVPPRLAVVEPPRPETATENYPWAAFDHEGGIDVEPSDYDHPGFYLDALREHLEEVTSHRDFASEKLEAIEDYIGRLEAAIEDTEEEVADRETAERDERDKYDGYSDEMF